MSPPNPPSTTTTPTATVAAAAPRLFPNPPPPISTKTPHYHHFPASASTTAAAEFEQILKSLNRRPANQISPVNGRGFVPKPITTAPLPVLVANSAGFPPRPFVLNPGRVPLGSQPPPVIRPTHFPNNVISSNGTLTKDNPIPTRPKAAASPSSASPASVSNSNGYKRTRDRTNDDSFATIRDRKVRISDGTSLYAQCRSWLQNGSPEEIKSQYVDIAKSLPRPFPPVVEAQSPEKKKDENLEEDNVDVDHLSHKELLQSHIKRAKRVRARLREERMRRISRYKSRLALLLPPIVEQHNRNDNASPN